MNVRTMRAADDDVVSSDQTMLLLVVQGEPTGAAIEIGGSPSMIGRADFCQLRVEDLHVSRLHCLVWQTGDRLYAADLSSSNGTFLNGVQMQAESIVEGDELEIGLTRLRVTSLEDAVRLCVKFARPPHYSREP